jgi:hypothetical protein
VAPSDSKIFLKDTKTLLLKIMGDTSKSISLSLRKTLILSSSLFRGTLKETDFTSLLFFPPSVVILNL